MSKETVKAFYEAAGKDTAIQEGLKELGEKFQGTPEEAVKTLITFAASKGYKFDAADINDFEKCHMQQLSPEELDNVNAAGISGACVAIGFGFGTNAGNKNGCGVFACFGIGVGIGGAAKNNIGK